MRGDVAMLRCGDVYVGGWMLVLREEGRLTFNVAIRLLRHGHKCR